MYNYVSSVKLNNDTSTNQKEFSKINPIMPFFKLLRHFAMKNPQFLLKILGNPKIFRPIQYNLIDFNSILDLSTKIVINTDNN